MTDSRLRDLERRWRTTGAEDDRLAYDSARVRAGEAIETGFIVRTQDLAGAYRHNAQVYLGEKRVRMVSFRKFIGTNRVVRDIEYADGAFHVLAFRRTGMNYISRIFTVDASGGSKVSFEQNTSHDGAPYALLNHDGVLGRIYADELHSIRFANATLSFLRDQTIFGCAGARGFVAMQAGIVVGGNPQVVALNERGEPRIVADGREKVQAVFVEGSTITCPTVEPRDKFFEGTRLGQRRYFADGELSLLRGYQGRALTLTKTLLEVPKSCLEGLLSVV